MRDATHTLDGILDNQLLPIEEHTTDTHGHTEMGTRDHPYDDQPNMRRRQARITRADEPIAAWRSGFPGAGRQLDDVIVPQMAQLFWLEPNWPFPWAKPSDAVTACPAEFA